MKMWQQFCLVLFFPVLCGAVEYSELEVYGSQVANLHELELETVSTVSSDARTDLTNRILRSSVEAHYGLTNSWEIAAYLDYTQPVDFAMEYSAFRSHLRTQFAEPGEWPVDTGFYFEVTLPRNFRAKDVGFDFKPIFEKQFSRLSLKLNPTVEFSHVAHVLGQNSVTLDPDGDLLAASDQSFSNEKSWLVSYNLGTSVAYRFQQRLQAELAYFIGFSDQTALLMPMLTLQIVNRLGVQIGYGLGLTSQTEQQLALLRLEYELYF